MKKGVIHKLVGGNGWHNSLCGSWGFENGSDCRRTWSRVTCKKCLRMKGTNRDWLEKKK